MQKYSVGQIGEALKAHLGHINVPFQVATDVYEAADTPYSLKLALLLKYGEYEQLVKSSCRVDSPFLLRKQEVEVHLNCLCDSLLSKLQGVKHVDLDPEATARVSFLAAESQCAQTNARFASIIRGGPSEHWDIISRVADEVYRILGEFDPEEWTNECRFGPGTSVGLYGDRVAPYYKMMARPTYCGSSPDLAEALVKGMPGWADVGKPLRLVAASKHRFVPKSAKTLRTIMVEPIVNLFAQKGLGNMIRKRLHRVGVDLDFGQARQQQLAKQGSLSGLLATLDLKAASDTVAFSVVEALLPRRWFSAMAAFRSPLVNLEGTAVRLHKFSSMGNGYTFELESLIFWALLRTCAREFNISQSDLGVYGDDIICPSRMVARFKTGYLDLFGFTLNEEKSHTEGYFRESCGGNYYAGKRITTLYIKEPVDAVREAFLLANRLHVRAISATYAEVEHCIERGRMRVVAAIPRPARVCTYPITMGETDVGLAVIDTEYNRYDEDLQLWFTEQYNWVSAAIQVRMEQYYTAKAHMLYSVEKADTTPARYRRVLPRRWADVSTDWKFNRFLYPTASTLSVTLGARGEPKAFRECALVPHRGRKAPVLRRVRYYSNPALYQPHG